MSRRKPITEYETEVVALGNSARIRAFKSHIGKRAKVTIMEKDNDVKRK